MGGLGHLEIFSAAVYARHIPAAEANRCRNLSPQSVCNCRIHPVGRRVDNLISVWVCFNHCAAATAVANSHTTTIGNGVWDRTPVHKITGAVERSTLALINPADQMRRPIRFQYRCL